MLDHKLQPGLTNRFIQVMETRNPSAKWTLGRADVLRHEPGIAKQGFQLTRVAEITVGQTLSGQRKVELGAFC